MSAYLTQHFKQYGVPLRKGYLAHFASQAVLVYCTNLVEQYAGWLTRKHQFRPATQWLPCAGQRGHDDTR